jgi:hypothetical protein
VSFDELMSVAEALPYALREQVVGFATFVEDAADALLEAAGVYDVQASLIDQLVYTAGVWRLWQSVNGQTSLLDSSLRLLENNGVDGVQLGGSTYDRRSPQYWMLTNLRSELRSVFRDSGLQFVLTSTSLSDLVRSVVQANGH